MNIIVSGTWVQRGEFLRENQSTGAQMAIFPSLDDANAFLGPHAEARFDLPFAVALPSVIVPVWNVVLFPQGPGFVDHVSLGAHEPLELDSRLFPVDATSEISSSN